MLKLSQRLSRRQLIKLGLAGVGVGGAASALYALRHDPSASIPPITDTTPVPGAGFNPMAVLRDFDYGTLKRENGRTIREFQVVGQAKTLQLNSAVSFVSWNYNGRIPGPTLRAKEGDRVRILFLNRGGHSHTMHFHGDHPVEMDGIKPVVNGNATIYEFDAKPFGVHLYHCHVSPVTRHISKGMYGMFIVDPPGSRPPADEMVLVMGGYDLDEDRRNELYAFNGIPNYYKQHPIPIYQNQLVRLYLLNMIEFDPAVTFHIHGNFFQVYPTGMTLKPSYASDVITMGTAERHILEFTYSHPGKFMFHPHQDDIAEAGCMGFFNAIPKNS